MSIEALRTALGDRYRIERELGAGGMAIVYLAHDIKHDRDVAIKVLRADFGAALGADRFQQEIRTTANLRHPNIMPLFDSGVTDATAAGGPLLYYVMPLVRGESLRIRLDRERQLSVDDALSITAQVASALDHAHAQRVIHRDIKPENILLQDGNAILTDFGVAVATNLETRNRLTGSGVALGTPGYMSPEQAAGDRDVDARSDIYALGAVTYEMLAGEPPIAGPTVQAMLARLMTEKPASLRIIRPVVTATMDAAILRALAKAPADRFATAHDFVRALTAASSPVGRLRGARLGWTFAAATAAIIVVGLAVRRFVVPSPANSNETIIRSIAVLPLANHSGDSAQAYFAEGMTDELTSDLATVSSLRVTSRRSAMQFHGDGPSAPEIARALNVDAIVEGSVTRIGDRVRITAQLIAARADRLVWSRTFERQSTDVLALQAELASAIAQEINVQVTPAERLRLAAQPAVNPEAYDAYLQGRYFLNRPSDDNLKKAITEFTEAITRSPALAPAYSGLSDAYIFAGSNDGFITATEARPRVKEAAEKAVALDSNSVEGHTSLAVYRAWYEHDWSGAEHEFQVALHLNPNYAYARNQLGVMLQLLGRFDESATEEELAAARDPLSPGVLVDYAGALGFQQHIPAARAVLQKAADLDPSFFLPPTADAWLDFQDGAFGDAIPKLEKARTLDAPGFVNAYLAYAYAMSGDGTRARALLAELPRAARSGRVAPFNLAIVYLGLGDYPRALDGLEAAYAGDAQFLCLIKVVRIFDPLRREPRFVALMKKMHFTA